MFFLPSIFPSSFLLSARDLHDIGCHIKVIDGCQQLDRETRYETMVYGMYLRNENEKDHDRLTLCVSHRVLGLPADFKEGVVFSTYATLISSIQKGTM